MCLRISGEVFDETRWALGTWQLRPEKDLVPEGSNELSPGSDIYTVYGPVDGYAVARAMGRAGDTTWRMPHRRITGGRGWLLDDDGGLVDEASGVAVVQASWVGSDAQLRRYEAGKEARIDMAQRRTVGVDAINGRVLWRHDGADFDCLEMIRYEVPVRCAFEGWRVYRQDWEGPRIRSAKAYLEGYDPTTGETTWRQRLSARAVRILALRFREMDIQIDRIADADELMVVPTHRGQRLLSLTDGSSLAVNGADVLLCSVSIPFQHRLDREGTADVVGFGDTRSRMVREPCDLRGRPAGAMPGVVGLLTGATDAGEGLWVTAGVTGIQAFELS